MHTARRKFRLVWLQFLIGYVLFAGSQLYALPAFMARFSVDPFSKVDLRNKCATCHNNPKGGGPRNPFGTAFEKNKHLVTAEFRRQWPDHFEQSITASAGDVKATMLANGQDTILEIAGQRYRLNTQTAKLDKIEPEAAAKLAETPPPPPRTIPEGKLPLRDQPTFDHHLVNLPTPLPYARHELAMRFSHRFSSPVLGCDGHCQSLGDLWGFDSKSESSIGGAFGITRRLTATVYRSPLDKTLELGGVFQLLSQRNKEPFSAAVRVSVEGRNNFGMSKIHDPRFPDLRSKTKHDCQCTTNLVFPVSATIYNFAELFVTPMMSFNANPDISFRSPTDPEGVLRRNQGAVGMGASIRFRPRTAFVVEWTPRVAGFHDMDSRNAYAFGLQRTTNGHVFELTLANTVATTTSRYVSSGAPEFSLGFNIYRRLR